MHQQRESSLAAKERLPLVVPGCRQRSSRLGWFQFLPGPFGRGDSSSGGGGNTAAWLPGKHRGRRFGSWCTSEQAKPCKMEGCVFNFCMCRAPWQGLAGSESLHGGGRGVEVGGCLCAEARVERTALFSLMGGGTPEELSFGTPRKGALADGRDHN